jgi:hypothetical protein
LSRGCAWRSRNSPLRSCKYFFSCTDCTLCLQVVWSTPATFVTLRALGENRRPLCSLTWLPALPGTQYPGCYLDHSILDYLRLVRIVFNSFYTVPYLSNKIVIYISCLLSIKILDLTVLLYVYF